jgi:plasmid stabilization system protein ParE
MALKIVWSKRASIKFDQIVTFLNDEWSKKSAKQFIAKVFDFLEILSEFPEIGSVENKEKIIALLAISSRQPSNTGGFPACRQARIMIGHIPGGYLSPALRLGI